MHPQHFIGRIAIFLVADILANSSGNCANLLVNSDFGKSYDGWLVSGTCQPFYDDVVGSPDPGSLGMNCLVPGATLEIASQCVDVTPAASADFVGRWTRNTSLPAANTVILEFEAFADPGCRGISLGVFAPTNVSDVAGNSCCGEPWHEAALRNVSLPGGTNSVAVKLGTGTGDVLVFDHLYFGPGSIFADGFER